MVTGKNKAKGKTLNISSASKDAKTKSDYLKSNIVNPGGIQSKTSNSLVVGLDDQEEEKES